MNLTRSFRVISQKLINKIKGYSFPKKGAVKYRIGRIQINLPRNHKLPLYQERHPHYDRFLPFLVGYLPKNSTVVDVGANVGDTLAAMVSGNPNLRYICLEADEFFFEQLTSNIQSIVDSEPTAEIFSHNALIGIKVDNADLKGDGSTNQASPGAGALRSISLDSVVSEIIQDSTVALIKSDVDGYDFDVIQSGSSLLRALPLIYFECDPRNSEQISGYIDLFENLSSKNYDRFAIFDNYGQLITIENRIRKLIDYIMYTYRIKTSPSTRTFDYIDILAFNSELHVDIPDVLKSYQN